MWVEGMPLKRCPFCGADVAEVVIFPVDMRERFSPRFGVVCHYDKGGCGGAGGLYKSPQEAVAMWNQRRRKWRNE